MEKRTEQQIYNAEATKRWRKRYPRKSLESNRQYEKKNRIERNASHRRLLRSAHATMRLIIIAEYGGSCTCPRCPEVNPKFLTVEHVGGWGAKDRRENGNNPTMLYRRVIDQGFPATYTILCSNCNSGKARNGGICPHLAGESTKTQRRMLWQT